MGMKKNLYNRYARQIELMAWDVAIAGMTNSEVVKSLIRSGARVGREVDWKKDPRLIGLIATGGLIFGSSLSLMTFLVH
jgi:hypothetical protein